MGLRNAMSNRLRTGRQDSRSRRAPAPTLGRRQSGLDLIVDVAAGGHDDLQRESGFLFAMGGGHQHGLSARDGFMHQVRELGIAATAIAAGARCRANEAAEADTSAKQNQRRDKRAGDEQTHIRRHQRQFGKRPDAGTDRGADCTLGEDVIEYAIVVGSRQRGWRRRSRVQQLQAVGRNTARKQGVMHACGILVVGEETRDMVAILVHMLVRLVSGRRVAPTKQAS